jgi:hypothetical protein
MPLRDSDEIIVPAESIEYIEKMEKYDGSLAKFEVIELFFEWLKLQPRKDQIIFLREALSE